jgi:hypothetical protein
MYACFLMRSGGGNIRVSVMRELIAFSCAMAVSLFDEPVRSGTISRTSSAGFQEY